jgi:outer membrane lipoprotein carrier protein
LSRVIALAALLCLCCFGVAAEPAAALRLGELLDGMRQLEARFHQRLIDERGEILQESSGRVVLSHPGRFRWETDAPFEQLVVSDGSTVWQYDPDLSQVVVRPLDKRADQVPSLLLSGEIDAVSRVFEITTGMAADPGVESFELQPRETDSLFSALSISFRDGVLARLVITDTLGQRTEVSFSDIDRSVSPGDELFHFEVPPGVDELIDE